MIDLSKPAPLLDAIDSLDRRSVVASSRSSAEWARESIAHRQRSFFSAGVTNAQFLEMARRQVQGAFDSAVALDENGRLTVNRADFVANMRQTARDLGIARPTDGSDSLAGGLQDIGSTRRLELIFDTQVKMAKGEARWVSEQDDDLLYLEPAWEFVRVEPRDNPRQDWQSRWLAAGGMIYEPDRMIALKDSPVWRGLGPFSQPWPPFDYNSGMGQRGVGRAECIRLGLIAGKDSPKAQTPPDARGQSLEALEEDTRARVREALGTAQAPEIRQAAWRDLDFIRRPDSFRPDSLAKAQADIAGDPEALRPLDITSLPDGGRPVLEDGRHRLLAALLAGRKTLPARLRRLNGLGETIAEETLDLSITGGLTAEIQELVREILGGE